MKKRILSLLLALVMLVGMLPTVALAADAQVDIGIEALLADSSAQIGIGAVDPNGEDATYDLYYAHATPGMKRESANRMGQYLRRIRESTEASKSSV